MIDKYDKYKIWKLPHPLLVHWILNPGLCINEVILGQRIPKISLIDETSSEPLPDRTYTECPHCETVHSSKIWGKGNAFFHYAGLYCPNCEHKIPTLLNVFSILVLIVTFPLWKPLDLLFGERFKSWELSRLRSTSTTSQKPVKVSGVKMGLQFGGFMGLFFFIQRGLTSGWTMESGAMAILSGLIAGIFFGVAMSFFMSKRGSNKRAT